jgi:hypothetical protein
LLLLCQKLLLALIEILPLSDNARNFIDFRLELEVGLEMLLLP